MGRGGGQERRVRHTCHAARRFSLELPPSFDYLGLSQGLLVYELDLPFTSISSVVLCGVYDQIANLFDVALYLASLLKAN